MRNVDIEAASHPYINYDNFQKYPLNEQEGWSGIRYAILSCFNFRYCIECRSILIQCIESDYIEYRYFYRLLIFRAVIYCDIWFYLFWIAGCRYIQLQRIQNIAHLHRTNHMMIKKKTYLLCHISHFRRLSFYIIRVYYLPLYKTILLLRRFGRCRWLSKSHKTLSSAERHKKYWIWIVAAV